jgi:hypothetical protein
MPAKKSKLRQATMQLESPVNQIVSIQEIIGKDGGGNDIYTEPIYEA